MHNHMPPPALRHWINAGLNSLLLDSPERVKELRAAVHSGATATQTASPQSVRKTRARQASPNTPEAHSSAAAPSLPFKQASTPPTKPVILSPDAWPAPWQALKNRRPLPPRPLVFWTYAGLGDDLMGTPDPARQQVIVRMLKELAHPGGTHVFWPYALPDDNTIPEPNAPSLFWSGTALLRPRALLLFGSEARDALGMPKTLMPYCQYRVDGRLIIQLPQPLTLAGKEDAFRRALAFLTRILAFCSR